MSNFNTFEEFLYEYILTRLNKPYICPSFIYQSIKTWNWIKSGNISGITLSEESLTDFNLLELTLRHPNNIKTQKFTKNQESKTGADWEWWIYESNHWIGLRIQAKKLYSNSSLYESLNESETQIEKLIKRASTNSIPLIPLYVFYNYSEDKTFFNEWECKIDPSCHIDDESWFGCTISYAPDVKKVLENKKREKGKGKKFIDIIKISYPWSCLVCCNTSSKNNFIPNRIFSFFKKAFFNKSDSETIELSDFIRLEPPNYVNKIKDGETLSDKDWNMLNNNKIGMVTVILNSKLNTKDSICNY